MSKDQRRASSAVNNDCLEWRLQSRKFKIEVQAKMNEKINFISKWKFYFKKLQLIVKLIQIYKEKNEKRIRI